MFGPRGFGLGLNAFSPLMAFGPQHITCESYFTSKTYYIICIYNMRRWERKSLVAGENKE